jgi:hypothetical protein
MVFSLKHIRIIREDGHRPEMTDGTGDIEGNVPAIKGTRAEVTNFPPNTEDPFCRALAGV